MSRVTALALVLAIGIGVALGCGPSGVREGGNPEPKADPKVEPGTPPAPNPNPQPAGGPNTGTGPQPHPSGGNPIAGAVNPGQPVAGPDVFSEPAQIFAGMPAEAHPNPNPDGAIERVAARVWLRDRLVGKKLRWTATVTDMTAEDGNDAWSVEAHLKIDRREIAVPGHVWFRMSFGPPVTVGGHRCEVCLNDGAQYATLGYWRCTPDEGRRLRSLKGKAVVFEATVKSIGLSFRDCRDKAPGAKELGEEYTACVVELRITPPSLDGWLPASHLPQPEKK